MPSKAVIFDFDGVIIDSVNIQRIALLESHKMVVSERASPPSFDEFLSHSGDSLDNIFRKMNLPQDMVAPYREISRKNIPAITVFEGIHQLLVKLRSRQIRCGICTGKDRLRTIEILKHKRLISFFSVVVCSDDVCNPKPHPESLQKAMAVLEVSPQHSIMVGDAPNDIRCAKAACVRSIGVSWGEASRYSFRDSTPDHWVNSVDELYSCILKNLV